MLDRRWFWLGVVLLVAGALGHSMWATSLDGFTIDEAYHVAAGATYVRWHDYRVNPEHPPLVKLVAGWAAGPRVLHLGPLEVFGGKPQERIYTQTAVYLKSDGHWVQRRARMALFVLNAALLVLLTVVLRRLLGQWVALATLLLLALEPTVSAHMPVVMTDLPMALLGLSCCGLALLVVRDGRWLDWVWLGLAQGFLLGTKHSAPLIVLPVLVVLVAGLVWRVRSGTWGKERVAGLLLALALSVATLWGLYGFRYYETPVMKGAAVQETFNRPLDMKIADLHSPLLKRSLGLAKRLHLAPRAYLWGLADTLRAGVEGRPSWVTAFGHSYRGKAPFWVPFVFLGAKAPIGFLALVVGGVWLLVTGRLEGETQWPLIALGVIGICFMVFIGLNGVYYAGLRHWLFAVPVMAVFGGVFLVYGWRMGDGVSNRVGWIALVVIAISVLPQRRIWEYHNELVGGSANAWKYFDNESVDLGQRSRELIAYYKSHMAPDEPLMGYWTSEEEEKAGGYKEWDPKPEEVGDGHIKGWVVARGSSTAARLWLHAEALRDATPVQRFGSLLIYHGTFYMPTVAGGILAHKASLEMEMEKPKADMKMVEGLLLRVAALNPESPRAHVLLGNFALERGERVIAVEWYKKALPQVDAQTGNDIRAQIARVEKAPPGKVAPLRDPFQE